MVINPIVGVYIPIIRIPIKGGMTIPNIATFDHGTCFLIGNCGRFWGIKLICCFFQKLWSCSFSMGHLNHCPKMKQKKLQSVLRSFFTTKMMMTFGWPHFFGHQKMINVVIFTCHNCILGRILYTPMQLHVFWREKISCWWLRNQVANEWSLVLKTLTIYDLWCYRVYSYIPFHSAANKIFQKFGFQDKHFLELLTLDPTKKSQEKIQQSCHLQSSRHIRDQSLTKEFFHCCRWSKGACYFERTEPKNPCPKPLHDGGDVRKTHTFLLIQIARWSFQHVVLKCRTHFEKKLVCFRHFFLKIWTPRSQTWFFSHFFGEQKFKNHIFSWAFFTNQSPRKVPKNGPPRRWSEMGPGAQSMRMPSGLFP